MCEAVDKEVGSIYICISTKIREFQSQTMAVGRKRRSGKPVGSAGETLVVESPQTDMSEGLKAGRFTFAEYMVAVLVFWLIVGAQFLVTWKWTGETIGMKYFFLTLGIGFTVVAFFSWLHDIFYRGDESGEPESSA
jgi:hypothetical protein